MTLPSIRATSSSARCCSGTRSGGAATTGLNMRRPGKPPLLAFDWEMVADAPPFQRPVNYALVRIEPPSGVAIDPDKRAVRHHRSTRRPRARHRRLQGGLAGWRRAQGGPSGLLRDLLPRTDGGTDPRRCRAGRSRVPAHRARAPPRARQAGGRSAIARAAGRPCWSGALDPDVRRPHRGERRADVVLGRQRCREPDALRRRHARRDLARAAGQRSWRRAVRRGLPRRELRVPEPGEHATSTSTTISSPRSTPSPSASWNSSAGGAASS